MRVEWRDRGTADPPLGVVFGAVLALTMALAAMWLALDLPLPACPLRRATGVPCPTCGATRLAEAVLRGEPARAFLENPLLFVTLASVALWGTASSATRVLGLRSPRVQLGRRERAVARVAAAAAVLAGWLYLVWRCASG